MLQDLSTKYVFRNSSYKPNFKLYKYIGKVKYYIDEIENKHLYLSKPSNFNDPFDCAVSFTKDNIGNIKGENHMYYLYCEKILSKKQLDTLGNKFKDKSYSSLSEYLHEIVKILSNNGDKVTFDQLLDRYCEAYNIGKILFHDSNTKVVCFSETNASIPMWAYYANSHKGVCLEYDLSLLNPKDFYQQKLLNAFHKVDYVEKSDFADLQATNAYTRKSKQWLHEMEWRIICETQEEYLPISCLSAIYVGCKADSSDRKLIVELAEKMNIPVFLARANVNEYKLDFVDFAKYSSEVYIKQIFQNAGFSYTEENVNKLAEDYRSVMKKCRK